MFGIDTGLSFFDSLNMVGYYARRTRRACAGRTTATARGLDYQADRLGVTVEHLGVGENFKPEVGFLRRSDFIESLAQLRISRRPAWWRAARRINLEFGLDYITNGERELENRLFQTALRTEMQSGDSWSVRYEQTYEFVPAPFSLPGGILVPVGAYSHPFGVAVYTLGSQRKISGEISTGSRRLLRRHAHGPGLPRPRRSCCRSSRWNLALA